PSEISGLIQQGLSFVRTDNAISMSSAATNTTSSQVPMIYQASFNDDWNGKLIGNRLCTSADVARDYAYNPANGQSTLQQNDSRCREEGTLWFKASWDAGKALQTQIGSRSLYTWNPAASAGMNLSAASLTAAQKTAFCETPACADEVAYLQGMDTHEARNGGPWRSRINAFKTDETVDRNKTAAADGAPRVLGDLINSSVLFVGRDDYGWAGFGGITYDMRQGYRQRKAVPRAEVLYVGGNDGMLHAFYADAGSANGGTLGSAGNGGKEIFAYVPYAVWDKLKALRDPEYTHEFYVDGSPTVGDAYLANSNSTHGWNTVLIGSTGAGGSGYFALDVEKPENFGAGSVLWDIRGPTVEIQYSGATATKVITAAPHTPDFVDLGYTLGQAAIMPVMTKTGDTHKWVAVFPNGYNSYLDRPMLYIVNLKDGALETGMRDNLGLVNYTTATTGNSEGSPTDPNGLSTPVLADVNGDGIVDVIYAGDLRGNLWRFRLNGGGAVDTAKIFEARDADGNSQPITARPEVGRDKTGNVMVYFGTGRYVARSDLADNSVQTFYGVRDICVMDTTSPGCTSGGALQRGNLLRQEFMGPDENRAYETGYDATIRVVSNHSMSDESGFYLDFKAQGSSKDMGERVIHTPLLWSDRLIFSTIIPNDDECEPGGDGWMYELDPSDGSRLEFAVFDLDHDGKFGDINDLSADGIPPSGLKVGMGSGVTARGDTKYHSNIKGKVTSIKNNKHPEMGRKSWRQLQ
ncbi:MAG: hypothetical protein LBF51_05390, partial [Zoogloeaceae bacterium]|nr:hypothetical protein [Zoogloeaceae bacterium]